MKNEADIENLQPDYIILDEFHRCGAMDWGKSVKKLLNAYKRLGLSKTRQFKFCFNSYYMVEKGSAIVFLVKGHQG